MSVHVFADDDTVLLSEYEWELLEWMYDFGDVYWQRDIIQCKKEQSNSVCKKLTLKVQLSV